MWRRLSAAIAEQQDRLDARTGLVLDGAESPPGWTDRVNALLEKAREHLAGDRLLEGWQEVYDVRQSMGDAIGESAAGTPVERARAELRMARTILDATTRASTCARPTRARSSSTCRSSSR